MMHICLQVLINLHPLIESRSSPLRVVVQSALAALISENTQTDPALLAGGKPSVAVMAVNGFKGGEQVGSIGTPKDSEGAQLP
mmetsp:Transcript_17340/g.33122  ORF Transcript_17340/g.33122 Transcript_17340/m.33122 type:complete len:83 (+) Transcript_17340:357-605(+)